jgi:hypothetical protein
METKKLINQRESAKFVGSPIKRTFMVTKKIFVENAIINKCSSCGYDKYKEALDIHHLDPKIKDKNFSSMRGWSIDRITNELKNCILLCKNCHTAYHCGYNIGV